MFVLGTKFQNLRYFKFICGWECHVNKVVIISWFRTIILNIFVVFLTKILVYIWFRHKKSKTPVILVLLAMEIHVNRPTVPVFYYKLGKVFLKRYYYIWLFIIISYYSYHVCLFNLKAENSDPEKYPLYHFKHLDVL